MNIGYLLANRPCMQCCTYVTGWACRQELPHGGRPLGPRLGHWLVSPQWQHNSQWLWRLHCYGKSTMLFLAHSNALVVFRVIYKICVFCMLWVLCFRIAIYLSAIANIYRDELWVLFVGEAGKLQVLLKPQQKQTKVSRQCKSCLK